MSSTEIIIFLGLATLVIGTQMGRHALTMRRLLLPLAAVVLVGRQYLQQVPTSGGSLEFVLSLTVAGAACGLLAAAMVRVEIDAVSGRLITWAGAGYATVWVVVLGGRLAFAYLAQHGWGEQVRQFSLAHALTADAWTAGFVLMALAMVVVRTGSIGLRALLLRPGQQFPRSAVLRRAA